jgi:hypothetical protein
MGISSFKVDYMPGIYTVCYRTNRRNILILLSGQWAQSWKVINNRGKGGHQHGPDMPFFPKVLGHHYRLGSGVVETMHETLSMSRIEETQVVKGIP